MTERTAVQTLAGAALAISASLPATYDSAGYGATGITYTTVGQIEDHGAHGVKKNVSTFVAVADSVVQKLAGAKDYGTKSLVVGYVPSDTGQDLIETAVESKAHYSVKITYALGDGEATNEIHYLDVLVTSREFQDGTVDNVRKLAVDFAVCRRPVIVAAT